MLLSRFYEKQEKIDDIMYIYEQISNYDDKILSKDEWKELYYSDKKWLKLGDLCYKNKLYLFALDCYINSLKYQQKKELNTMKKISLLYARLSRFSIFIIIIL